MVSASELPIGKRHMTEPWRTSDVLERGLLPENFPPIFNSGQLSPFYQNVTDYLVDRDTVGSPATFSASKRGGQRRTFSLPHPTFIFDQSLFFARHWGQLQSHFLRSSGSLSTPVLSLTGPRPIKITRHAELPLARLKKFSRFKYCLVTDISRYFPSIYTHSIPWAINGKAAAKADQKYDSATTFGNRLDFIIRQSQERQTIGIPIGPDTSRVTSEIILCATDQEFMGKYSNATPSYIRHVDDYWVGGNSLEDCELHLRNLRAALRDYQLDINELKTHIVPTSRVLGDSWPSEIEKEIKDSFVERNSRSLDPLATLSKIVELARDRNDDGIIRHTIRKIDESKSWVGEWGILEHFLAHCAIQFPHSFDYIARVISWRHRTDKEYDNTLWSEVIEQIIGNGAPLGRDSEVLWGMWLRKELSQKLFARESDAIIEGKSSLPLALFAHFYAKGQIEGGRAADQLWESVDLLPFSGKSWPLSLELQHLEIRDPIGQRQTASESLTMLHNGRASLVRWDARPRIFEQTQDAEEPEVAIEDVFSDYDTDESANEIEIPDF